ncbi:unnamed protein product [Taenia asiatica]|uniref:Fucosyltransferase n=1 Tax=Taenia asiatica TaxID=60517 RepID=A0A0R3WFZ8_TAEAS|nr:unnamed protein product [Taenia asiatica]
MGAYKEDYESILPPHSYINVDDFTSISELTGYLQYLNKNDTAYAEYFAWKEYGEIYGHQGECSLTCTGVDEQPVVVGHLVWSLASPLVVWSEDNRDARMLPLQLSTPLVRMPPSSISFRQAVERTKSTGTAVPKVLTGAPDINIESLKAHTG